LSDQRFHTIIRKARIWPELPKETIHIPQPLHIQSTANPTILITTLFSVAGVCTYTMFLSHNDAHSPFFTGIFVMSSCLFLGSLLNFFLQWIPAQRRKHKQIRHYLQQVAEIMAHIETLSLQERQGKGELDPPLIAFPALPATASARLNIEPILQRSFDNQDVHLWSRRPDDPDFFSVRIGMGQQPGGFSITEQQSISSIVSSQLQLAMEQLQNHVHAHKTLLLPVTVTLDAYSTTAIVGSEKRVEQARHLAMTMIAYLSYHHSPEDVRIIILAPESKREQWEWTLQLPHTLLYDPRMSVKNNEQQTEHAVALNNETILQLLPFISREVSRRELLLGDIHPSLQPKARPILPRLFIVIDHFDELHDLDGPTQFLPAVRVPTRQQRTTQFNRPRLTVSPLRRAEMTRALNASSTIGVSVLAVCGQRSDIPAAAGQLIDLDPDGVTAQKQQDRTRARLRYLQADAPPCRPCEWLDEVSHEALCYFANRQQPLRPMTTKRLELRTQVDLSTLFEPRLDLTQYDPYIYWKDTELRMTDAQPLMRIPIGLKIGDEVQYLDLRKDGPHGLLIGQTGSGKSELLQTIITSLAVLYHPGEVNFLLIDYKAGLALEPFRRLPHTIGFLSNVSSTALIDRFITMLRAEAMRREIYIKEGRAIPRLVIIIDEFAEMAKRTESVLDELFTITRVGREIGMHLLLSAQRPEGIIGNKVRDYVQYRLCLRCASPEDSREVLRRVDAASLPASIPGRGYLLHGDNQLDLFQAARVTIPKLTFTSSLLQLRRKQGDAL